MISVANKQMVPGARAVEYSIARTPKRFAFVRVIPEILRSCPAGKNGSMRRRLWDQRYRSIVDFGVILIERKPGS